jgi:hypothetical protein
VSVEDLKVRYNLPEEESGDRNRRRSVSEAGMKDGFVLFVVCVLVIAGIGMWSSGVDPFSALPTPTLRSQPWVVEAHPTRAPEPVATPKAAPSKVRQPQPKETVPAETHPAKAPEPVVVASVAVPEVSQPVARPKPFPVADQVKVGTKKTEITEQYGMPSLITTTNGEGHVVENLIYSKAEGNGETVIRIQDGKVLSAYSR